MTNANIPHFTISKNAMAAFEVLDRARCVRAAKNILVDRGYTDETAFDVVGQLMNKNVAYADLEETILNYY